jgi:hypothetical protein
VPYSRHTSSSTHKRPHVLDTRSFVHGDRIHTLWIPAHTRDTMHLMCNITRNHDLPHIKALKAECSVRNNITTRCPKSGFTDKSHTREAPRARGQRSSRQRLKAHTMPFTEEAYHPPSRNHPFTRSVPARVQTHLQGWDGNYCHQAPSPAQHATYEARDVMETEARNTMSIVRHYLIFWGF